MTGPEPIKPKMKYELTKKVELVANVAIIVVALAVGVALYKNYFTKNPPNSPPVNNQVSKGTKVALADVDWGKTDQTLVLALSAECRFCTESAPFYQHLIREKAGSKSFELIAVLPQPESRGREYLKNLGVDIEQVKQAEPRTFGVQGTPTLLLVNKNGEVIDVCFGFGKFTGIAHTIAEVHVHAFKCPKS